MEVIGIVVTAVIFYTNVFQIKHFVFSTVGTKDESGTGIVIEEAEIVDCEGKRVLSFLNLTFLIHT